MIKGIFPIEKWDFNSAAILEQLPAEEREMLLGHMQESRLPAGQLLFKENTQPKGMYLVCEGKVKKFKCDREGREQIIYVATTGELVGYHALLAGERFPDSAATLEHSRIGFIPKEVLSQLLSSSKVLPFCLLKLLSHEFTVLTNSISLFALRSVRERFAMQLIVLREKYKQHFVPGTAVEINMSREDMAALVGTGRENITRILQDFKREGILETKGRKVIIFDVHKLIAIVNQ